MEETIDIIQPCIFSCASISTRAHTNFAPLKFLTENIRMKYIISDRTKNFKKILKRLLFSVIAIGLISSFPLSSLAVTAKSAVLPIKSIKVAKRIALENFKIFTKNKVKKISCELIKEDLKEWLFVFEDADVVPTPGSEVYVVVEKSTGKVTIFYGR